MAKTEPKSTPVLSDEHKRIAEYIFAEKLKAYRSGANLEMAALESFKAAGQFLKTLTAIEAGELSAEPDAPEVTEYIEVERWRLKTGDKGVRPGFEASDWEKVKESTTGKILTEVAPVDRDAFAPNLPPNHPINVRFKPRDGVSAADRIAKIKALREADLQAKEEQRRIDEIATF